MIIHIIPFINIIVRISHFFLLDLLVYEELNLPYTEVVYYNIIQGQEEFIKKEKQ